MPFEVKERRLSASSPSSSTMRSRVLLPVRSMIAIEHLPPFGAGNSGTTPRARYVTAVLVTQAGALQMSTPKRFRRLRAVLDRRQPDLTVLLEDVQVPRNLTAILRSCDAVGVF